MFSPTSSERGVIRVGPALRPPVAMTARAQREGAIRATTFLETGLASAFPGTGR